jgi:tetratricopeptide (TPR) repeat protein
MDRYLQNLLSWAAKPRDWQSGMRAMELAAKLGLVDHVMWIGDQVLPIAQNDGKAKKDQFVKLMEIFSKVGDYDHAQRAGDAAMALDPTDGKLAAQVKNTSAQATMSRGGFEGGVQSGHFRRNIKDADKQRELEEEESLAKTDETFERLINRAKTRLRDNPDDQDTLNKLARLLLERGTERDEKEAYNLLMKASERFKSYRWKQQAGDIQMRVARRKLGSFREAAEAEPNDAEKQQRYKQARKKVLDLELSEFRERVQNYPTDLKLKFELGWRLFEAGEFEEAISHLQRAKGASGIGSQARGYLARCFLNLGWITEAEDTYREAINAHGAAGDRVGLDLRYGLMTALKRRAEEQQDLEAAKEASDLAGKIAMEQFGYRDIKQVREQLQGLVKTLREG